ncbi:MAG: phosphoenolpyruvate carboxykinase [Alphaproteobacteria bacterium]|nr:phosphoenolpyruvate carboxykinase [Alphaproteobacteria bacterium]MDP6813805.1 phosphoenolpyruvate carboxykinase [Alphaproteobacteria bacterium]
MTRIGAHASRHGLDIHGIINTGTEYWNLSTAALYEMALANGDGELAEGGALVCRTGVHTGRSANDKFIVHETASENDVDWGPVNRPIEADQFDAILQAQLPHYQGRDLYVLDCWAGADRSHRLGVRVVTEQAWHNLFARNMFLRASVDELADFEPQFTILHAPGLEAPAGTPGLRSGTYILVSFERRLVIIGGTSYAGEIKKSVFSILNYLLPAQGVLPMHCSVNVGPAGDSAIFFGLSGTGKTTLSADPTRMLIGDDEHGWGDNGIFNFEGGCYAKVINLSAEAEPEIFATTRRFGTILENVVMDPDSRRLDLDDGRHTENTRASYPLDFIPNASPTGIAGHPRNVVMLTADAFGVLPPLSKLTPEQAMYHFLSGYTAKVAGTEKGVGKEPQATFSTCFGAPFMSRHPTVYGNMLRDLIARHGVDCWLVNTGWTGGSYGVGYRMPIRHTRGLLAAALEGKLADVPLRRDDNFGLLVPEACPDVPGDILSPRGTWGDGGAYDDQARDLVHRFQDNFAKYDAYVDDGIKAAAPQAA